MVGVLVGILAGYVGPVRGYLDQRSALSSERETLRALELRRDGLARRLRALKEPVVLEMRARELGFIRPGERVFYVRSLRPSPPLARLDEGESSGGLSLP